MPINLFDPTIERLGKALAVHQQRHEVVVSNIANVETPGYHAREVDFRGSLEAAFAAPPGAGGDAGAVQAKVIDDPEGPVGADGNSVDIDLQMAKLAANSGRFNTLAKILGKRFAILRQAIDGVR